MFATLKSLRKTGGILALIAGVLAIFAAQLMFIVAGIYGTLNSTSFASLLWSELGTVLLSFLTAVLGIISMNASSRTPGVLLVITAILTAVHGGLPVALFMVVALVGAVLILIGDNRFVAGSSSL